MRRMALLVGLSFLSTITLAQENSASLRVARAQITLAQQVEVPALEIGIIGRLIVKEGDLIEDGQLLGSLDEADAKLTLTRAEIEAAITAETAKSDVAIRAAQNGHETARAELARALEAIEKYKKSVSQTEIDRLKLAVDQSKLSIEQAQLTQRTTQLQADLKNSELAIARRKLERHEIRARVTGRVLEINKHVGEWVEPGKSVLKIARLDRLRCKGFVDPAVLTLDPTGNAVLVKVSVGKNKSLSLPGKLVFVASDVSLNNDIEIWAEFDNRDRLVRPGMPAEMEILPAEKLATTKQGPVQQ